MDSRSPTSGSTAAVLLIIPFIAATVFVAGTVFLHGGILQGTPWQRVSLIMAMPTGVVTILAFAGALRELFRTGRRWRKILILALSANILAIGFILLGVFS